MESFRCPQPKTLGELALGKIASPEAERLEDHLAQCPDCAATLHELSDTDTFVQEVASSGKKAELPEAEHKVVELLMERLAKMPAPDSLGKERPNPTHPPLSKADATQSDDGASEGRGASLTDFLSPPQADDELGRLGKYRILRVLGHGGMGVVYQAEDPKLKRRVAIKAMLPSLAASASAGKRFLREAQAMAAVEHPHIVRIYQVDEERGVPFMAMEFLKGEPLDARLKRDERLPVAEVLRIGREIAQGLAAAHATGLIHRDIKPANIWLETRRESREERREAKKEGQESKIESPALDSQLSPLDQPCVKILDFGLARAGTQDAGLTQLGAIVGTPAFMAPEQGRGDAMDARCDLFSLGVVLYRLCTGQLPFQGTDTVSTLMSVATHEPPPPIEINADVPPELSDLVMHLLEKDLDKRIGSAGEVVKALQKLEKQLFREAEGGAETVALSAAPSRRETAERKKQGGAAVLGAGSSASRKRGQRRLVIAAALLLILAPLGWLYGGVLFRFATNQGELVIEVNDPAVEVKIVHNGVVIEDKTSKRAFTLTAGKGDIEVLEKDGIKLATRQFELTRGGKMTVKVTLQELAEARKPRGPGPAAKKNPPAIPAAAAVVVMVTAVLVRSEVTEMPPPVIGLRAVKRPS